jgi:YD repeat-containing protein
MITPGESYQEYRYDNFGNLTNVTNELNKTWTTEYDEFRRPKRVTDPLQRYTEYSYELPGGECCNYTEPKPSKITLPSGKKTEIAYDAEWNIIRETVGAGSADEASTHMQYNIIGNRVAIIDPMGKIWKMKYDTMNRVESEMDPLDNTTRFWYDKSGRTDSIKRPDNTTIKYFFDDINRITKITNPKNQETIQQYDTEGNLVKLTDPNKNIYTYEYNKLNRKTKTTYPDDSFEKWNYDAVGNLDTFTNRAGNTQYFKYDNRNRDTASGWDDNITPSISKTYDNANRLMKITSPVSTLSYTYNNANEKLSETQAIVGDSEPDSIKYTYTSDGLRETLTYPSGKIISYDYTDRNRVASIKEDGQTLASYNYDLNGNRTGKSLKNGITEKYAYDNANRILSIDNNNKATCASITRFDYGYDNLDRIKYVVRNNDKGDAFTYNDIDQLTNIKYGALNPDGSPSSPARTVHYDWDAAGNRTQVVDNGTVTKYTPNKLNQYVNVGDTALEYTANGNLKTRDGWKFTYDAQDRLIQLEKGNAPGTQNLRAQSETVAVDSLIKLSYDVFGRLVKSVVNGISTFNYFNGLAKIEEKNDSNESKKMYILSAQEQAELLAQVGPAGTIYFHHDGEGKIVMITNQTGDVVENHSSDALDGNTLIIDKDGNVIPLSQYPSFSPIGEIGMEKLVSDMRIAPRTGHVYDTRTGIWGNDPRTFELELPFYGGKRTFKPATGQGSSWWQWTLDLASEYFTGVGETYVGEAKGVYGAAKGTVLGLAHTIAHPIETAKGIGHAVYNYKETGAMIKGAIAQRYDKLSSGSYMDQGEVTGEILFTIASILSGAAQTKVIAEAGAIGKGAEIASKAGSAGKFLFESWHMGTFPNRLQSILYHLNKHGKGRTAFEYTKDAMSFFNQNKNLGIQVILKDGTHGLKIQTRLSLNGKTHKVGGYWTHDGRLVTFWD